MTAPRPEPVAAWLLLPRDTTRRDDCWHCRNHPGYAHRHWQQQAAPPRQPRPMGPVMRVLSRIWGEG